MNLSTGDKIRVALAPLHLFLGGVLLYRFAKGARVPTVALLGASFVAYGVYRIFLVGRTLRGRAWR